MKTRLPLQLIVLIIIVVIGGGALVGEYLIVKWYPVHLQHVEDATLKAFPFRNDALGVEMQVAAGLYGKVQPFPGGVRIQRWKLLGPGPSLTITSQANPDSAFTFSPQILAVWEAQGAIRSIPDYDFEHVKINDRDAALIWQRKGQYMQLTAHVISPERVVEVDCTPGAEDDVNLYMQACDQTVHTIKVAGPAPPPPATPSMQEVTPGQ